MPNRVTGKTVVKRTAGTLLERFGHVPLEELTPLLLIVGVPLSIAVPGNPTIASCRHQRICVEKSRLERHVKKQAGMPALSRCSDYSGNSSVSCLATSPAHNRTCCSTSMSHSPESLTALPDEWQSSSGQRRSLPTTCIPHQEHWSHPVVASARAVVYSLLPSSWTAVNASNALSYGWHQCDPYTDWSPVFAMIRIVVGGPISASEVRFEDCGGEAVEKR